MSETPVPDDIAGAEGTDSASEQDATDQVAQASAITLIPKAGEWVVVRVEAGDKIALPFMLAGARGLLRDGNIEIVLPNGGVVVLQGYLAAVQGEPPLQLTDANGESVDLEDFIVAIDELEDLSQIALLQILGLTEEELAVLTEGGALQNISPPIHDGGASFTQEPSLTIVDGIEEKGALLATELSYGVPEIDDRETIPLDDDEEPGPTDQIWSIDGGESVVEGDNAIYTVSYTGASLAPGQTMTISVATSGGYDSSLNDAAAGSDYTALGTVLTFTGGSATSQTVAVSTIDDTVVEGSEDYSVTIDDQSVGTIGTSQSNTVITDDDETNVTWNITGSSQVNEGDTAQYTVSYTGGALAPGATALVTVATGLADIDPMDAIAGSDYTSLTTILTFTGGGVTQRTVAVSTIEDTLVEPTEDYEVAITASLGAVVTDSQHTNIVDDDATSLVWSITPGGLSIDEAEHDVATVSYTGATIAPGFTALVTVATGPGWTGSLIDAQANVDYTAFTTVLTFTSGTGTSQMIGISTLNDTLVEGTEDFTVTIGSVSSGTIGASQVNASIIDDDTSNLVWNVFGNSTVTEGSQTTYSVSYTGAALAPGITATITVATGNAVGAPPNATPGVDYTALSTVLTFTGGGVTQRTVAVSTIQDTLVEGTEDYAVIISNQSVGVVGTGQVNTHIADDDIAWSISPATASDTEGTTRNYTVSYSGAIQAGQTATITVATGNNNVSTFPNATAGADYTAVSTVLTFTSGTGTQRTVAVSTIQDT
ncbi:MAG: Calx-beta domain-containing protein, partial [Rhodospirillaceae bacterium]|nr:Calx-beta domain-containing protein [Rhodospirillaceae bacterium]